MTVITIVMTMMTMPTTVMQDGLTTAEYGDPCPAKPWLLPDHSWLRLHHHDDDDCEDDVDDDCEDDHDGDNNEDKDEAMNGR